MFPLASHARRACEARALRARKTLTPRFTDFFTDFEKKNPTVLQSSPLRVPLAGKRVSLLPGTTCLHINGALDL